ncbi:MAG: ATP synthase F1 subunit gamma [Candidatus Nomurabacteria bacterium]|nr:ATP synthase F1 subunit gamma [Candidatus Nomurabacteria bacterium]
MASTKEIKRRIQSVKSTKKITKAMELVAASKMKRAVSQTLASRIYSSYSWEILTSLSERIENLSHKFFVKNTNNEKYLIVLITSNRGLCGGYNSQVIKRVIAQIKNKNTEQSVDIISVGKKGDGAMRRTDQNIIATFTDIPDNVSMRDITSLSTYVTNEFKNEKYSKVYIAYTHFLSALNQKPVVKKILPISKDKFKKILDANAEEKLKNSHASSEIPYLIEGDTSTLLDTLAEKLVRMQIYQMMLESKASEQSSRMVAMKNANEAAGEMIDDLTLVFNKARQANITREISEISAGMASIN